MTALFCAPLDFAVVGSQAISTAPASNANLDEPGLVWRNPGSGYLIADMGANASYDTVALISNLRPFDTIQIQTGSGSSGTGALNISASAYGGYKPSAMATKTLIRLGSVRTERYLRIDITATGHPAGYFEVQRLITGKAITTLGVDYNADQSIIDLSSIETKGGSDLIDVIVPRMRWKFSMGWVDVESWHQEWLDLLLKVGRVRPVFFVPFVETAGLLQQQAIFGRFRSDVTAKAISYSKRSLDLTIEGLAP